jgi:hypothetical protein
MITTEQLVPGITTSAGPAIVVDGESYVLAWKGASGSGLYWGSCPVSDEVYQWTDHHQIDGVGTSAGPALACFKGRIYMAWKGEGTDEGIYMSVHDSLPSTSAWAAQTRVPGVGGTSDAPALAATGDALFLAWKAEPGDDRIFWSKSSDGKTWTPQQPVPGVGGTSSAPALTAYGDTVYLAWKAEPGDNRLFWSKCTDGANWAPQSVVKGAGGTSTGPALGTGSTGIVHLAWKGEADSRIWTNHLESGGSPQQWIPVVETSDRPALASQPAGSNATILLAWKGASDDKVWVGPLDSLAAQKPPAPDMLVWSAPETGFGSGPTDASFSAGLTLTSKGTAMFAGEYTDSGTIPVFDAPSQNYSVAAAVVASNKKVFTFTHSKSNVPTGGAKDAWGTSSWLASLSPAPNSQEVVPIVTNDALAANWDEIATQSYCKFKCSNDSNLGELIEGLINDISELLGYAEDALEVIAVVAA